MKSGYDNLTRAKPLTLALSGGGAKCAAQAGVLAVLEGARLPVGAIVGVSAGGLVGVLYGLGYAPQAIRDYIADQSLLEVWELDPSGQAIFGPDKMRARLRDAIGDKTFADLRIPVTLIAADLNTGREIHLSSGRLDDALMATMAIPGFFTPALLDGMTLVDGGILNPLPVDVARKLGSRVVAVDVIYDHSPQEPTQIFEARGPVQYATEIGRRLRLTGIVDGVYQSVLIATIRMCDHIMRATPPDVLLRPAVGKVGLFAFDLADMAYHRGEDAALAALPRLEALAHPTVASQVSTALKKVSKRIASRAPRL